jgi:ribose transport system ATP-binding protein
VSGVDKRFPGVHALKQVSFDCRSGEIHGLVGENGAQVDVDACFRVHRPDSGSIRVRGHEVVLTSPRVAHDLGIAMVYQDTSRRGIDVAQNIWLEREPGSAVFIDRAEMARRSAARILRRLGIDLDRAARFAN